MVKVERTNVQLADLVPPSELELINRRTQEQLQFWRSGMCVRGLLKGCSVREISRSIFSRSFAGTHALSVCRLF
jgi:hypothetical protein